MNDVEEERWLWVWVPAAANLVSAVIVYRAL